MWDGRVRVSVYGVNVAPLMAGRVLLSRILRLCQGVNLRGRANGRWRGTKVKSPQGKPLTDQYLDPSISPPASLPLSLSPPLERPERPKVSIRRRTMPNGRNMLLKYPTGTSRGWEAPSSFGNSGRGTFQAREIISQRESNSNSPRRDPSFPHPRRIFLLPFLEDFYFSREIYFRACIFLQNPRNVIKPDASEILFRKFFEFYNLKKYLVEAVNQLNEYESKSEKIENTVSKKLEQISFTERSGCKTQQHNLFQPSNTPCLGIQLQAVCTVSKSRAKREKERERERERERETKRDRIATCSASERGKASVTNPYTGGIVTFGIATNLALLSFPPFPLLKDLQHLNLS